MARNTKKTTGKRYNVPSETLERARAELKGEVGSIEAPETAAAPVPSAKATPVKAAPKRATTFAKSNRVPTVAELAQEYAFVWRELRLLGLLTAGLFIVILVAAVVLPRLG